jgi:hypothetical protein
MIRSAGRALRIMLVVAAVLGAAWFLIARGAGGWFGAGELQRALTGRGRVAVFGSPALLALRPEGTSLLSSASVLGVQRALDGRDVPSLLASLEASSVDAVFVEAPQQGQSLRAQLAGYRHVDGLRGLYLSRRGALYGHDAVQALPRSHREAAAVVARRLLQGARVPSVGSFPEPLRRVRPVEVMVLLRHSGRARLWRSARGSSIASALLTAAVIARQRWQEREQAMGGSLERWLPQLDVEVALLEEDGTIAERDPAFIDRVFFPGHGVGYERKGAWRYLLPETTQLESKGTASRAYRKLFTDDGLPPDSFDRHDLRLYRLMVQNIATSRGTAPSDASSPKSPADSLRADQRP